MDTPREGETVTYERTFTREDVRQFAAVSHDRQARHTEPDDDGRLLVHGLLTATLPTKIGSDFEVLASDMDFHFRRPVYAGDRITCEVTWASVDDRGDHRAVEADVVCSDADGDVVLTGGFEGIVE